MKRPSGWRPNPQAMAQASQAAVFGGDERLGRQIDVDTWLTPSYILGQLGYFDTDPARRGVHLGRSR